MLKVVRFVKMVTMLMFIVALAIPYFEIANDSRMVVLYTNAEKQPLLRVSPNYFFYGFAAFFGLFNVLISIVNQLLARYPVSSLPLPNRDFWLRDADSRQNLREILQSWVQFLAAIFNTFLAVLSVKIWLINRRQGGEAHEYLYFVLALVGILLIWFGFIFYRLRVKREEFVR